MTMSCIVYTMLYTYDYMHVVNDIHKGLKYIICLKAAMDLWAITIGLSLEIPIQGYNVYSSLYTE